MSTDYELLWYDFKCYLKLPEDSRVFNVVLKVVNDLTVSSYDKGLQELMYLSYFVDL